MHRCVWSDFFNEQQPVPIKNQNFNSRQTPSGSSVYVLNCLFNGCTSTGDGGALSCGTSVTHLLVESSSFFSCKTNSNYGGAIYFSNTNNGQCVLREVCGFDCISTSTNYACSMFAYIEVYDNILSKNELNYTSIKRCGNNVTYSQWGFYLGNGKISCSSVNVSNNKCYYQPGGVYNPSYDSNSATCSFFYSTFVDNIVDYHAILWFRKDNAKYEMKSCNILRNKQGVLNSLGLYYVCGSMKIENSCLLDNKANYIFYGYSSFSFTLSSCTIDKTTNNGNLVTRNTVTKSFILGLNHMSTHNCHSEYDSFGTLTPIITPSSSTKQRLCYTYVKFFYQCPYGNLFIIAYISSVLKLLPQ
jgi:hypothetical protein